jgi:hypothetical protein
MGPGEAGLDACGRCGGGLKSSASLRRALRLSELTEEKDKAWVEAADEVHYLAAFLLLCLRTSLLSVPSTRSCY